MASAEIWETEPNNSPPTAMLVPLGQTVLGAITPAGDADVFAIDVQAGTRLDIDVDAHVAGSPLDATLQLLAPNGQTVLQSQDQDVHEYDGSLDPRIRFTAGASGRYFVALRAVGGVGGPQHSYRISLAVYQPPAPGAGDPVAVYAADFSQLSRMVAAHNGDLFVTDGGRVRRVSPSGQVSDVASGFAATSGLALDAFGNLLVAGCEYPNGVIWRITPGGERTRFFTGSATPLAMTVDAQGDLWVADYDSRQIWEFDAQGIRRTVAAGSPDGIVGDLAFSPAGELHFTAGSGLYKLVGTAPQLVAPQPALDGWRWQLATIAFDVEGYLYASIADRVILLNPQYQRVSDPFAWGNDQFGIARISDLVFLRDAAGATSGRLVMAHSVTAPEPPFARLERILELNRSAIRAPGWPVGVTGPPMLSIHPPTLPDATPGVEYVQPLSVHGAQGPIVWSISAGALPSGIVLGETSGMLAGVPLATGSFAFTARAVDASRDATRDYTLTVGGDVLPVTLAENDTAVVDSPYTNTLRMPDATGPVTWTLLSGSLPPGITLDEGTGALAGVPADTGAYSFSVRGQSLERLGFGTLSIAVTTDGLAIEASALMTGVVSVAYADTLRVQNASGSARWYITAGKLPPGLRLTRETGEVSGTPEGSGDFTFDVLALRGFRWGRATITMSVVQPDVAVEDAVEAMLGGAALSPEMERYLDYRGNRNGSLDVGDVRAFLRRSLEQARMRRTDQ
jgi:hypothetical protein